MHVLVVSECFPPAWSWGGPTRSIWHLCLGLYRAGARVRVVTTNSDMRVALPLPRQREEQGIPVTTVPIVGWAGPRVCRYALAPGLGREIRSAARGVDLAVLQGVWTYPVAAGARALLRARVPFVLCPRGTLESISLGEKSGRKRLYRRWVEGLALTRAAAMQFDTHREWQNSRAATGSVPAIVQPLGMDFAPRVARDGAALRAELGVDERAQLLGLAGRLNPRKGFDVILPALTGLAPRVHLVSFGANQDGYRAVLEREVARFGVAERVHFMGSLDGDRLQAAYASIDLLVLPSHGESFGNVVVEALAQGTPVLVSDRVPLGDWVLEQGLGGVVSGAEPGDWSAAIASRLAAPVPFDRDRAARLARDAFDLERTGRALLAAFEAILAGRARPAGTGPPGEIGGSA